MFVAEFQDFSDNLAVFLEVVRKDQDIVHVDDDAEVFDLLDKNLVHHMLERGRGVGESKEHDEWFEQAVACDESWFPLVAFFDADIVESPSYVEFAEEFGVFDFIEDVLDQR